jgi:thioredoxin domain-containing protein 5
VEEIEGSPSPGIHLAQVNCVVYGGSCFISKVLGISDKPRHIADLCADNDVSGYPQMNIYRDGKFVETFKGARDYDRVTSFMSKHAEPTSPTSYSLPHVPSETETPLHIQSARTVPNPEGMVMALNGRNFQKALEQGPLFVKFFAPWYLYQP